MPRWFPPLSWLTETEVIQHSQQRPLFCKTGTWSLTKQASYDVISRKVEVLGDVVEDTSECADA